MHRLPNLLGLPARFLVVSLSLFLLQSSPSPAWSQPAVKPSLATALTPSCPELDCSIRIQFTGQTQTWVVPAGSGNFRIELAGAAGGGEHGGSGALIKADLKVAPGQVLEFRIGGAGKRGDNAPGGYNGGGRAGSGAIAAGSGGGMSQLFLDSAAVLVAGGGGGAGGGTAGGAAGMEGEAGANGKYSTGGGGGQAFSGGQAGQSGRVSQEATRGQAGEGGAGASMQLAVPGGGGGGGYFGGGGGGAAYSSCCHQGSGGGGGSSYADSRYLSNVEAGRAPIGSGYAVVRYQLFPEVASHSWTPVNSGSGELRVDFTLPVGSVRLDRVALVGCQQVLAAPIGPSPSKSWKFTLKSCAGQSLSFILRSQAAAATTSSGATTSGPSSDWKIALAFNATPTKLKFQGANLFKTSTAAILLVSDSELVGFSGSDFRTSGCAAPTVRATAAGKEITLLNCRDGQNSLRLLSGSVSDASGNSLPSGDLTFSFRVDLKPPQANLRLSELDSEAGSARVELILTEPVGSPLIVLQRQLKAANCRSDWLERSQLLFIGNISCKAAITLTVPQDSLTDAAGRTGPATAVSLTLAFESSDTTPVAVPDLAIPPWIPVGGPSDNPPALPTEQTSPNESAATDVNETASATWAMFDSSLIRYLGIAALILLALLLGLGAIRSGRRSGQSEKPKSTKNDGSLTVDKYPVFSKPAHRLS